MARRVPLLVGLAEDVGGGNFGDEAISIEPPEILVESKTSQGTAVAMKLRSSLGNGFMGRSCQAEVE
jgi:hypothetical protein